MRHCGGHLDVPATVRPISGCGKFTAGRGAHSGSHVFVQRMRKHFPGVGVTETHPKAVWKALKMKSGSAFVKRYAKRAEIRDDQEHENDAIISAVAAREGFEGRWPNDLGRARNPSEQDPSTFWLAPIHYFWPEE